MITVNSKKLIWVPILCIAPAILLILMFKLLPILSTVADSFLFQGQPSFQNYAFLLSDPSFWKSLWVTVKFNIITTPLQILLAIALALLVNQKLRGISWFRTVFYFPVTMSMTVATIIWGMMLNPNNGLINGILKAIHLPAQPFMTSEAQALWCIIVIASWKGVGYWMMFILAGLQGIDHSIYEAARIDGSGWWRTTCSMTLPLLKNSLLFVVVANTTANLLLFAPMYVITKGGPNGSTNVLMYEAYKSAFLYVDRERAAAVMTILLLIISAVVGVQFYLAGRGERASRPAHRRTAV